MSALTVIYSRSRHIGSLLIRAGAWFGPWSHSAVVTPENTVIEARAWTGVREVPMAEFLVRATHAEAVQIACPRPDLALAYARAQVGKPYDFGAVLGFISRRNWGDRERAECTELVESALVAGGNERFRIPTRSIHPCTSYNVR